MKRLLLISVIIFSVQTLVAQESFKSSNGYFTANELPDMRKWMPGPPAEDSAEFALDQARYEWGKAQREDAQRLAQAKKQAIATVENFCDEFSEPFGMTISKQTTPEIYTLILDAVSTCAQITVLSKEHHMRRRPYVYYGEGTPLPQFEEKMGKNGSFPSGHTARGWAAALILTEVNPAAADALLKMGYMQGDSRIIVGYHWQSDVTASRIAASAAVAYLHTSDRFLRQKKRAKKEFAKLNKRRK